MAIRPISNVSFENISFGNRRNKKHSVRNRMAASTAALLLAVPTNAQVSRLPDINTYTKSINKNWQVLDTYVSDYWYDFAGQDEKYPRTTLHFIDTDGNDDTVEKIIIEEAIDKYGKRGKKYLILSGLIKEQQKMINGEYGDEFEFKAIGKVKADTPQGVRVADSEHSFIGLTSATFNLLCNFISFKSNNGAINIVLQTKED